MSKSDVIRAWKDPFYRATLSEEMRASLPQHPAGITELSDDRLTTANGATVLTTAFDCTDYTYAHMRSCCPKT
ncbi:MAG TPA: mersacidin/lichenicidin family type 2 lantibiotic [Thermoanaerobaculia bacterium]